VTLKGLQQIVFRGTRPQSLLSLISRIIYPLHTKIVLACYLPHNHTYLDSHVFPRGMQLPIPTSPKCIRYRLVHDMESSETRACIDLISTDGRHTLIENRHGWREDHTLHTAELWAIQGLDGPCLKFLQAIDLSSVERLCFERCVPNPGIVKKLMGAMGKLGTLVVVDGDPYIPCMATQGLESGKLICPLLRRLVIRCDLDIYISWGQTVRIWEARAAQGLPLEQVTLTSSFSELLKEPAVSVELLEKITGVRYDLGRSAVGWEWWME